MGLTCTTEPGSRGPWKWDVRVLVGAIGIGDAGKRGQGRRYGVGQSVGIAGRAVLLVLKQKLPKVTLLLPQEGKPARAHLPSWKGLLWLLMQRFLPHQSHTEIRSLTWGATEGNCTEHLPFRLRL